MYDLSNFVSRYSRFVNLGIVADRVAPSFLRDFVARWLGRLASPYRLHAGRIVSAMQTGLGLSAKDSRSSWRRWRESHGQVCLTVLTYPRWTPEILENGLVSSDLALLRRAASTGGLVLTYHSHHQNSLCSLFGLAGAKISVLAASEESSPLFPAIGNFIHRINRGSAMHFGGGDYLFTDNLRSLVKVVKAEFDAGALIASLCDFSAGSEAYAFLGRQIAPPKGAITLALKQHVPIYTAILYGGCGNKPVLRMQEIDRTYGEQGVILEYLEFLTKVVKEAPWAWQGWDWFLDMPPLSTAVEVKAFRSEITKGE